MRVEIEIIPYETKGEFLGLTFSAPCSGSLTGAGYEKGQPWPWDSPGPRYQGTLAAFVQSVPGVFKGLLRSPLNAIHFIPLVPNKPGYVSYR